MVTEINGRELPKAGELFMHFKGKMYKVLHIAKNSENHDEFFVVYEQLYFPYEVYIRPLEMFMSPVDKAKYPDVEYTWRFSRKSDMDSTK